MSSETQNEYKYYNVTGVIVGEKESLYGSYVKDDCIYEAETEKAAWKEQGYKKIKIETSLTNEAPDATIYKDQIPTFSKEQQENIINIERQEKENIIKLGIPQSVDKIEKHFDYVNNNNDYHGQATEQNIADKVDRYEMGIKEIKKLKYLKKQVMPFLSTQQKKDFKAIDKAISKYENLTYKHIKSEISKDKSNNKNMPSLTRKVKQAHCSLDNSRCL